MYEADESADELGRYRRPKIPRSEQQCTLCDMEEVEDELHFVFRCPRLAEARKPLLRNVGQVLVQSRVERFS